MQRRRQVKKAEPSVAEQTIVPGQDAQVMARALTSNVGITLMTKILHFTLYSTDGYINIDSGTATRLANETTGDKTSIIGWGPAFAAMGGTADAPENIFPINNPVVTPDGTLNPVPAGYAITGPIYVWGFTDIDPDFSPTGANALAYPVNPADFPNIAKVPTGAYSPATVDPNFGGGANSGYHGNAKVPAPYIECKHMDNVFVTLYNRGFLQNQQAVQDDHTLHFHGIHAQTPYDGVPETAGGYVENLRYFWEETWFKQKGTAVVPPTPYTPKALDDWWNGLTKATQQTYLNNYLTFPGNPLWARVIRENRLNPAGGVINKRNTGQPYPFGTDGLTPTEIEQKTQFTYYFTPMHIGTFMYHCHVAASEHVQMGMYGALIVRPMDFSTSQLAFKTAFGYGTNTTFDVEYTLMLSDFDARWHKSIEGDPLFANYYAAQWRPDIWMVNGRTFPMDLFDFKWNKPATSLDPDSYFVDPRYNTYIKSLPKQKIYVRYIHMGYQAVPQHQHGWHMRIVGRDGMKTQVQQEVYTLHLGSGETWDCITVADPAYGQTAAAGSILSTPNTDSPSGLETSGTLKWRIMYIQHSHNDYTVTTNHLYPGGALVVMETCVPVASVPKAPPNNGSAIQNLYNLCPNGKIGRPSWENAYIGASCPTYMDGRNDIEAVPAPSSCPGLPPT